MVGRTAIDVTHTYTAHRWIPRGASFLCFGLTFPSPLRGWFLLTPLSGVSLRSTPGYRPRPLRGRITNAPAGLAH